MRAVTKGPLVALLGFLLLCSVAGADSQEQGLLANLRAAWAQSLDTLSSFDLLHHLGWLKPTHPAQPDPTPEADDTDFADADDASVHAHWALLIAGSNGWGNYRHQADVCHAYQVLRRGGYNPSRIVVMVYDDIANNALNPFPGQIFNRPGGPDVYQGLVPDYTGADVTSETFLAVLTGNKNAVNGKGNGKVIASGPNDRVFVFYSDHGAPGILGMPSGGFLYADHLLDAIKVKRRNGGFKEMVLYIEACESGSMFEGLLPSNLGVYAVTASNSEESSWGTYCPIGDRTSQPDIMGTCLGDLFSVAWMENAEEVDLRIETLLIQFFLVRMRTSNNFTYIMGSHAMQFGNLRMQKERAGDYEGTGNTGPDAPSQLLLAASNGGGGTAAGAKRPHHAVRQRDADLEPLRHQYAVAQDPARKAAAKDALDREVTKRRSVDLTVQHAAAQLLRHPRASPVLKHKLGVAAAHAFKRSSVASQLQLQPELLADALADNDLLTSLLVTSTLPGRPKLGVPVVDDWSCLRAMVQQWESSCGAMDQYAMRHTRFLANLCNAGIAPSQLSDALLGCSAPQQGEVATAA